MSEEKSLKEFVKSKANGGLSLEEFVEQLAKLEMIQEQTKGDTKTILEIIRSTLDIKEPKGFVTVPKMEDWLLLFGPLDKCILRSRCVCKASDGKRQSWFGFEYDRNRAELVINQQKERFIVRAGKQMRSHLFTVSLILNGKIEHLAIPRMENKDTYELVSITGKPEGDFDTIGELLISFFVSIKQKVPVADQSAIGFLDSIILSLKTAKAEWELPADKRAIVTDDSKAMCKKKELDKLIEYLRLRVAQFVKTFEQSPDIWPSTRWLLDQLTGKLGEKTIRTTFGDCSYSLQLKSLVESLCKPMLQVIEASLYDRLELEIWASFLRLLCGLGKSKEIVFVDNDILSLFWFRFVPSCETFIPIGMFMRALWLSVNHNRKKGVLPFNMFSTCLKNAMGWTEKTVITNDAWIDLGKKLGWGATLHDDLESVCDLEGACAPWFDLECDRDDANGRIRNHVGDLTLDLMVRGGSETEMVLCCLVDNYITHSMIYRRSVSELEFYADGELKKFSGIRELMEFVVASRQTMKEFGTWYSSTIRRDWNRMKHHHVTPLTDAQLRVELQKYYTDCAVFARMHDVDEKAAVTPSTVMRTEQERREWREVKAKFGMPLSILEKDLVLGELLGTGGFGVVNEATMGKKRVAYKRLASHRRTREFTVRSYIREAVTLANIDDPCVVHLINVVIDRIDSDKESIEGLILEFIDGKTLQETIWDKETKVHKRMKYLIDMAKTFDRLHTKGKLVYRDAKPFNAIVRSSDDRVVLIDFGMAVALIDDQAHVTSSAGTPNYRAPEQINGEGNLSTKTDVYAFGVMIPEVMTGQQWTMTDAQKLAGKLAEFPSFDPDPVCELMKSLCVRCVQVKPADRPPFSEIVTELERINLILPPVKH